MKRIKKRQLVIVARLVFGLLTLVAIGKQLSVHAQAGYSILNFFSYFTNLSNIFAAVMLLVGAGFLMQKRSFGLKLEIIRTTSVVCMAIVGIVFSLLLRNTDLGSLLPWVNFVLHYLMPVVIVTDWLLSPPKAALTLRQVSYGFAFPIVYLIYSLIRGANVGFYPYPFLNPTKSGGYLGVTLYCIAILVIFVGVSWVLILASNKLKGERTKS